MKDITEYTNKLFKIMFQDVQHKMRDHFRGVLDEYNSNEKASEAEVLFQHFQHLLLELFMFVFSLL